MKIREKIIEDKRFIFTGLVVLILFFLFLNSKFWHNIFSGSLLSVCYLTFTSLWLGKILSKFLSLEKTFQFFFGLFLIFYLIAFGLAVPIVFFKISIVYFYVFLLIFTLIISFLSHHLSRKDEILKERQVLNNPQNHNSKCSEFGIWNLFRNWKLEIRNFIYILFFIFYILAWYFLIRARTGDYIVSPWDVISSHYTILWLIISFLLVLFIFFEKKSRVILIILILASFLFHAYLPLVGENNFGVDKWRHLGTERRIIDGSVESPSLLDQNIQYKKIGPFNVPSVFFAPYKFSYSNQWGMTIALSWLTVIDIFWLDLFLVYFFWSIFFVLLIYKLALLIFNVQKLALLIVFTSLFCFFSLQIAGGITIPHVIGFLPFLFFLLLFFEYLGGRKSIWPLILISFVLLVFNYILYLIIALEIFIFGLVLKSKKGGFKKIVLSLLIFLFILSLPLLDRLSGVSFFKYRPLEAIKFLPLKLLEFANIFLPYWKIWPQLTIEKVGYLYCHGGEKLFLPNILSSVPWVLIFTPLVFIMAIFGFFRNFRKNIFVKIFLFFFIILVANQFISFSLMKNYRLLCSRLNNVIILILSIFFAAGLYGLFKKANPVRCLSSNGVKKLKFLAILLVAIFLSLFSLTTYVSGPAYGVVTRTDLEVAKFINQEIKKNTEIKPSMICVFDAGWRLLALESVNGMIAGNFPSDSVDFVQKEKDELYRKMLKQPSQEVLNKTLEVTGAERCFFVTERKWLKTDIFDKIKELLGEPKEIDNVYIWKY